MLHVGLDVGSTTAKMVVINENGDLLFSRYERHNAQVEQLIERYFGELHAVVGDSELELCVTGSVGMAAAEVLGAEFVQEVVAASTYARVRYPQAKALIDIGGEDAKVVFFNGKQTELRMNGNCAGGTGAFIDQMSALMGLTNDELNSQALRAEHIYPIAARCGVFAKTDIQNLTSRNLPTADIAASIFHSIAVQTVTTLSHGMDFRPPILLCGGPLTFLPALRKALANYLHLEESDFIVSEQSNLAPALGCALRQGTAVKLSKNAGGNVCIKLENECSKGCGTTVENNSQQKSTSRSSLNIPNSIIKSELTPLFKDEQEHAEWRKQKAAYTLDVKPLEAGRQDVFIGIDSGSTTTKIVVLRRGDNRLEPVFTYYAPNLGNPIKAAGEGLEQLSAEARKRKADLHVVGSCSTGYGEELIKAAFHLDHGIIETMAHYRAAASLAPDVSFILDIGGQDMKAIFVEHGAVVRMELNEACSSGCGTFIQTFATSLGYDLDTFARMACTANEPCDLGTRCTVFMNSKVKQVLRDGATIADISAGLSYSVVKNCLYKVLKLRGSDALGQRVVVQGGTMRNDSVVRAFELLTHTEVARSSAPELMGALGCALFASAHAKETSAFSPDNARFTTRQLTCRGCENQCLVSQYTFAGGNKFYSGNKCERVFNNNGKGTTIGQNIYAEKYKLLFDRPTLPTAETTRRIGIPRVLNMYEDYPFWNTLLRECGIEVVLSSNSTLKHYESALGSVMSDNICFPAKLAHSHIAELEKAGVERILMPYVVYEHNDDERTLNSYNCPIVSGYSDVIRSAMEPKVPVDSPVINFSNERMLRKQISQYLKSIGIKRTTIYKAFDAAAEAQRQYDRAIRQKASEILETSQREGRLTIMLAGRPYHTDPLVQHKLSEMIAALGVDVISDDLVRGDTETAVGEIYPVKQWAYVNRIVKAAQWAATQPSTVHFVEMTSFGCGPDAFIQDEVRDILWRHNKPFTLLKIDDVSNIGSLKLRVRSLVESLRSESSVASTAAPFEQTRIFTPQDAKRKIIVPFFTEYISPLLPALFSLVDYDIEVLPQSDNESVDFGLEYANNEICYPATLIVGDIIKALKSGRYDTTNVAVAMSQTGGQCRATSYAGIIKRAMIANGFKDVPLITLGVATTASSDDNEQVGFDIPWKRYVKTIVTTILFGDTISKFYHSAVVREREAGAARRLRDKYMSLVDIRIRTNDSRGIMRLIKEAAQEFDAIVVDKELPKVGIVGEIFLKFHPFAHQYIAEHIMDKGIEVVPPLLAPFFLQEFVNVEVQKQMRLSCSKTPNFLVHSIYHQMVGRRLEKINRIASRYRYFRPFTDIYEDAHNAESIVSLAAQFGEGWLLPADIIGYVNEGVNNVVSLQPFGCIANHIVSKGIEKKLHKLYPQLNLLSLDFDSGVSAVNVTNRLLLFLDNIDS